MKTAVPARSLYCLALLLLLFHDMFASLSQAAFHSATKTLRARTGSKIAMSSSVASFPTIPRAAVSVCVRCTLPDTVTPYYLLIQRGNEPNKGMWSLPGGKLEFGEGTVEGGARELEEETKWTDTDAWESLRWYSRTACTTDSIGESYHFMIAHCYAETRSESLPNIIAADDAAAADWFTSAEIQAKCDQSQATPGLMTVLNRIEDLSKYGLLPLTVKYS
jgi:ADP-ribose pyrophosphatase YjhB (NUDIX family)